MATTWKNTQQSLNLPDSEFSLSVKKRIASYNQYVTDLAEINKALGVKGISQADKEEADIAKTELTRRIVDLNDILTKDMIRLDRDKELNKTRRERLAANPGKGRGHKKDKSTVTTAAPVTDDKTTTSTTTPAPTTTTTKATATTDPKKKDSSWGAAIFGSIVAFVGGAFLGKKLQ